MYDLHFLGTDTYGITATARPLLTEIPPMEDPDGSHMSRTPSGGFSGSLRIDTRTRTGKLRASSRMNSTILPENPLPMIRELTSVLHVPRSESVAE